MHMTSCPVCNSPVNFSSSYTNFIVCKTCKSSLSRKTGGGVDISSVSVLKQDETGVVHTGSHGEWNGRSFEVTGRLKCYFDGFHSNRWTILFADGTTQLLVETDGFLAIYEEVKDASKNKMETLNTTMLGTEAIMIVTDRRSFIFNRSFCSNMFIEGEVYTETEGLKFNAYELGDEGPGRMEVVDTKNGGPYCWQLYYVTAGELKLKVPEIVHAAKEVACAHCKKSTRLLVPQYSRFFTCSGCKGWNEIEPNGTITYKDSSFDEITGIVPVGTKGIINDTEYIITCITQKLEVGSPKIYWREYTLFSLTAGFAFLSEFNGHWIFLQEAKFNERWLDYKKEIEVDGEPFLLYNEYSYKITDAVGESCVPFSTPGILAKEFISPPEIYAAEKNKNKELAWFKGRHITSEEVELAFAEASPQMPLQSGVGAVQPMPFYMNMGLLQRMTLLCIGLFLIMQVILSKMSGEKVLFEANYTGLVDTIASKGLITPSFELDKWKSNLEFRISSPVSNSWFEASMTLVNDANGKEYSFEKGVEYYYGITEGESWSEGSSSSEILLSSLPGGKYHMNIFPSFDNITPQDKREFSISVVNDVPMWSNVFVMIGLLLIYPVIQWFRNRSFEKRRWYGSENNPYANSYDED